MLHLLQTDTIHYSAAQKLFLIGIVIVMLIAHIIIKAAQDKEDR